MYSHLYLQIIFLSDQTSKKLFCHVHFSTLNCQLIHEHNRATTVLTKNNNLLCLRTFLLLYPFCLLSSPYVAEIAPCLTTYILSLPLAPCAPCQMITTPLPFAELHSLERGNNGSNGMESINALPIKLSARGESDDDLRCSYFKTCHKFSSSLAKGNDASPAELNDLSYQEEELHRDVEITENDVLCGQGGESNYHKGNVQFRNLIKQHQPLYVQSVSSKEKSAIPRSIIKKIHKVTPLGRFLKKNSNA